MLYVFFFLLSNIRHRVATYCQKATRHHPTAYIDLIVWNLIIECDLFHFFCSIFFPAAVFLVVEEIQFYLKHSAIERWLDTSYTIHRIYLYFHSLLRNTIEVNWSPILVHVLELFRGVWHVALMVLRIVDVCGECTLVPVSLCSTMQFHHEFESNWMISTP